MPLLDGFVQGQRDSLRGNRNVCRGYVITDRHHSATLTFDNDDAEEIALVEINMTDRRRNDRLSLKWKGSFVFWPSFDHR